MREQACLIREVTLVRIETLEQRFLFSGFQPPFATERPYGTAGRPSLWCGDGV